MRHPSFRVSLLALALAPALALALAAGPAFAQLPAASTVKRMADAVVFHGPINARTAATFRQLLQDTTIRRLVITSPGGIVSAALDMADPDYPPQRVDIAMNDGGIGIDLQLAPIGGRQPQTSALLAQIDKRGSHFLVTLRSSNAAVDGKTRIPPGSDIVAVGQRLPVGQVRAEPRHLLVAADHQPQRGAEAGPAEQVFPGLQREAAAAQGGQPAEGRQQGAGQSGRDRQQEVRQTVDPRRKLLGVEGIFTLLSKDILSLPKTMATGCGQSISGSGVASGAGACHNRPGRGSARPRPAARA